MKATRRQFLKESGTLLVYFSLPVSAVLAGVAQSAQNTGSQAKLALDTWIRLGADGKVIISVGKVELGQGISTALAQIAAEELDVKMSRIQLTSVDTAYSPDESYTFSSISIMQSGSAIRRAAAEARRILIGLAREALQDSSASISVEDGLIFNAGKKTGLDYWQLLAGRNFNVEVPEVVVGKPRDQYRVVGRAVQRLDIPAKVFGQAAFLVDLRLPEMVHARVIRPPAARARLLGFDSKAVEKTTGFLKLIHDGSFLAVLAERQKQADQAADLLRTSCRWQLAGDLPDSARLPEWLKSAKSKIYPVAAHASGNTREIAATVSESYSRPFLAHASISPSAAVALKNDDGLTVWSHGQGMYPLRGAIASIVGLEDHQVRCIFMEASGCYGQNGADDAACDAAVIAMKYPGRPIRLQWSRADEFGWEPLGSAMAIEINAGLDADGLIVDWKYEVWSCTHTSRPAGAKGAGNLLYAQHRINPIKQPPAKAIPQPSGGGDRNAVPLYDFAQTRISKHLVTEMPLRVSALRGLGAYANIFAIESFMDEMAHRSSMDPFDYRARQLTDQRAIDVLTRLKEISKWSQRPEGGNGEGWGVGFARFKNLTAYVGIVFKLQLDPVSGQIRLNKAYAVIDAGLIINPDGTRAQIEGGVIQSASWTVKEQMQFSNSEIQSRDWVSYPILRFEEVPDVEVEIINRPDQKPLGLGEAAQGPTAAAIANAVFHASNRRIRDLPISPDKLLNLSFTNG